MCKHKPRRAAAPQFAFGVTCQCLTRCAAATFSSLAVSHQYGVRERGGPSTEPSPVPFQRPSDRWFDFRSQNFWLRWPVGNKNGSQLLVSDKVRSGKAKRLSSI